jgi:hypothetical protein
MDLPRELPNFEKMVLLGQQILELEAYRRVPFDIEEIPAGTPPKYINININIKYI